MLRIQILRNQPDWFELSQSINQKIMKVTLTNAKVGDEVIYTSTKYPNGKSNPVYNGSEGKVTGIITQVNDRFIGVKWSNGYVNHYDNDCLETAPAVVVAPVVAQLPLKDIVEAVIASEFIAKNVQFSAYDVTSKVRREINEGRAIIAGKAKEDVNGMQTQRVAHDDIRAFVRDYMNNVSSFDRRFNGDYIVYQPNAFASAQSAASTFAKVPVCVPPLKRLIFTPTAVVASPAVNAGGLNAKIAAYVSGKGARTLKQIQSRFKIDNGPQFTIRELADYAKIAGLRIDVKSPYYASVVTK